MRVHESKVREPVTRFKRAYSAFPVPRSAFVFGKLLGGTSLAFIQGILFMLLAPIVGIPVSSIPITLLLLALVAFSLTALGYIIAWKMDSTKGCPNHRAPSGANRQAHWA